MPTFAGRQRRKMLDAAGEARLVDAWKDPEVTVRALIERFRIHQADIRDLERQHGPKARPSSGSLAFGALVRRPRVRRSTSENTQPKELKR